MLCLCGFELYSRWVPLSALKYCTEFEPLFLPSVETYLDKLLESTRCLLPLFGVFYIPATQRKLIANMF